MVVKDPDGIPVEFFASAGRSTVVDRSVKARRLGSSADRGEDVTERAVGACDEVGVSYERMNEVITGQRRAVGLARPQRRSAEGVGWFVVVAGVALGSVRFVGEGAAMRSMTSLLAAVAFGAVVSAPGVAVVVGVRCAAPALLVAAALALAPLSLLSPVTLPLMVIAIVLVVAWARRPQVGPLGSSRAHRRIALSGGHHVGERSILVVRSSTEH